MNKTIETVIVKNLLIILILFVSLQTCLHAIGWSREGEFLIDRNFLCVPAPQYQVGASVAFDGSNYLVIWQDLRGSHTDFDIYGARLNSQGEVIDTTGFPISTAFNDQGGASVAFDGANYLVVWADERSGYWFRNIYGARVTPSGTVLDPAGILICDAPDWQSAPSVAFDGTNYLVVWSDQRGISSDIYGARVNPSGTVLDSIGIPISADVNQGEAGANIAFDGNNYLVAWHDGRNGSWDIYGTRVDPSGTVLDTAGFPISSAANGKVSPKIAFDGANYLVVWTEERDSTLNLDVYGARVSPSGVVLDTTGFPISTAVNYQWRQYLAFDGINYVVVWQDDRNGSYDICCSRVDTSGTVIDTAGIPISADTNQESGPSLAFDGTNCLVVWTDERNGYSDIYGSRVNHSGVVLDTSGILISNDIYVYAQDCPAAAFDGSNFLVVWEDKRSDSSDIYAARVNPAGIVLDTTSIPISAAPGLQMSPAIAFNGINYLVVWRDDHNGSDDIYGARISQSGVVLDTNGIPISTAANNQILPSVASYGTNYLVVWQDERSGSNDDIYGTRVSSSGIVLDTSGIPISIAFDWQKSPSVASDSTNYMVVWADERSGFDDIYGSRVSASGTILDTAGIPISTALDNQMFPAIDFDGINYLVVWQDFRSGYYYYTDIYGARVNPSGNVIDTSGIAISTAPGFQVFPAVTFDGTDHNVVWQNLRDEEYSDIYGVLVNPHGSTSWEFTVSNQPGDQVSPTLTHGINDTIFVTYAGFTDSINGHAANTMRIWGKFYKYVAVEETKNKTPNTKSLLIAYPNPFFEKTNIKFAMHNSQFGLENSSLKIYDAAGRIVRDFTNYLASDAINNFSLIAWEGQDDTGIKLPGGVYFIQLKADGYEHVEKVILLR